jgi:thiamine transport system substrate-binding protein
MYPAVTPAGGLPQGFSALISPDTALLYPANEAELARDEALRQWLLALTQ